MQNNKVVHNTSVVTGWWTDPGTGEVLPAGDGLELTDLPLSSGVAPAVTDNVVGFNDFRGSAIEIYLFPEGTDNNNTISRKLGENRGHGIAPSSVFAPIQ